MAKRTIDEFGIVDLEIARAAKNTTEEFFDLYGESPVLYEINDVIKNSSKEKLKAFS